VGGSNDPAVLRLMPPLNVSAAAIEKFMEAIHAFDGELKAGSS